MSSRIHELVTLSHLLRKRSTYFHLWSPVVESLQLVFTGAMMLVIQLRRESSQTISFVNEVNKRYQECFTCSGMSSLAGHKCLYPVCFSKSHASAGTTDIYKEWKRKDRFPLTYFRSLERKAKQDYRQHMVKESHQHLLDCSAFPPSSIQKSLMVLAEGLLSYILWPQQLSLLTPPPHFCVVFNKL